MVAMASAAGAQTPAPKPPAPSSPTKAQPPKPTGAQKPVVAPPMAERINEVALGDLDDMVKRRRIRLLIPYNKTSYFIDRGVQRGVAYDFFKMVEDDLNRKLKTGNLRVHVVFIPTSRDQLGDALLKGRGDIAAGNLTITEARQQIADFSEPVLDSVKEV